MSDSDRSQRRSNSPARETPTDRTVNSVLNACRKVDPEAHVTCCKRNHTGHTVINVNSSSGHTATELAAALQELMPLSKVSTEQNILTGDVEAIIIVPTWTDEWKTAHSKAVQSTASNLFLYASLVVLLLGIGGWISNAYTNVQQHAI